MNLNLDGSVAVVTGGTSGIGLATAQILLEEGGNVAVCGRDPEKVRSVESELADQYGKERVLGAVCNVLDNVQVQAFKAQVEQAFGGCDILINNAGGGRISTFADTTDDAWLEESRLKLFSVIYPTRAYLPLLELSPAASVVVVNSLLALQPEPHMVATSSARAGLLNLTCSMAAEFASKNIRVNSILLGTVASGQWARRYQDQRIGDESYGEYLSRLAKEKSIPLGRFGRPEEAAKALVYLASSASSYTTGSTIDVSGGVVRHI